MNDVIRQARTWYENLAQRDRHIVQGLGVLITLTLVFSIVRPVYVWHHTLEQRVAGQRELIVWLQHSAAEVERLRGVQPVTKGGDASLFSLVDQNARSSSFAATVKSIQPGNDQQVRMHVESAPFDALVQWLSQMQMRYGLTVAAIEVDRSTDTGTVNASITLQRSTP